MKEADVLKACRDLLELKKIKYYRTNNIPAYDPKRGCYRTFHGTKGMPDILASLPICPCCSKCGESFGVIGQFTGIEIKSPTGKLSEDQEREINEIDQAGGMAMVVHSVDELVEFLAEEGF